MKKVQLTKKEIMILVVQVMLLMKLSIIQIQVIIIVLALVCGEQKIEDVSILKH